MSKEPVPPTPAPAGRPNLAAVFTGFAGRRRDRDTAVEERPDPAAEVAPEAKKPATAADASGEPAPKVPAVNGHTPKSVPAERSAPKAESASEQVKPAVPEQRSTVEEKTQAEVPKPAAAEAKRPAPAHAAAPEPEKPRPEAGTPAPPPEAAPRDVATDEVPVQPQPEAAAPAPQQATGPQVDPAPVVADPPAPVPPSISAALGNQPLPAGADDQEDEDPGSVVRPYTWTGGRTRSSYDLRVETLVSTTKRGRDTAALTSVEHRTIADLCQHPRSVAEVAAHLSVPLGVVRVLLSDMAEVGLLIIHETEVGDDAAAQMLLMERVLSGLRRL